MKTIRPIMGYCVSKLEHEGENDSVVCEGTVDDAMAVVPYGGNWSVWGGN